jgi:hypothetical protein
MAAMGRTFTGIFLSLMAAVWVGALRSQPVTPGPTSVPATARKPQSFGQKVLQTFGIPIGAGTLKGAEDTPPAGQVWVVDLGSGTRTRVAPGGGYRSPLFIPGSTDILALQGTNVVRIASPAVEPKRLYSIEGITKLVSFGISDPDQVLVLKESDAGQVSVNVLALGTGKLWPMVYDSGSKEDEQMLESLQASERTYGGKTVYVKHISKDAMSGRVEWSDVFIKPLGQDPKNVSRCDGVDCGQPSVSADGRRIAFIMGET